MSEEYVEDELGALSFTVCEYRSWSGIFLSLLASASLKWRLTKKPTPSRFSPVYVHRKHAIVKQGTCHTMGLSAFLIPFVLSCEVEMRLSFVFSTTSFPRGSPTFGAVSRAFPGVLFSFLHSNAADVLRGIGACKETKQ